MESTLLSHFTLNNKIHEYKIKSKKNSKHNTFKLDKEEFVSIMSYSIFIKKKNKKERNTHTHTNTHLK